MLNMQDGIVSFSLKGGKIQTIIALFINGHIFHTVLSSKKDLHAYFGEIPNKSVFFRDLLKHFTTTYGVGDEFFTIKIKHGRGLLLKFYIGDKLGINHPSKQVHAKIDLNYFRATKTATERTPTI